MLDPFMGSGTRVIVARRMGRSAIGIEIVPEYFRLLEEKLEPFRSTLFDFRESEARREFAEKLLIPVHIEFSSCFPIQCSN